MKMSIRERFRECLKLSDVKPSTAMVSAHLPPEFRDPMEQKLEQLMLSDRELEEIAPKVAKVIDDAIAEGFQAWLVEHLKERPAGTKIKLVDALRLYYVKVVGSPDLQLIQGGLSDEQ
jgi:hypothetical protein